MQVERFWVLMAKKLSAQATQAELDELAGCANHQAHLHVLTSVFNNVQSTGSAFKKDTTNLLQRIHCINSYTNHFFTGDTNH